MNILEFEAKALLREQGISVPKGQIVTTPADAAAAARDLGGAVVIKVQIPIGGRMKAGGIRFADTPEKAEAEARDLLGKEIRSYVVERVLIEQKLNITREVFIAATYDTAARSAVLLASSDGGIEIESSAGRMVQRAFSSASPMPDYIGREIAAELGFHGGQLPELAELIAQVGRCFSRWDALLLELNPVVLDSNGQWWAADIHLELDDDAAWRQQSLLSKLPISAQLGNRRSEFEQRAIEIDSADHRGVAGRLVPLGGSLGLLIGGGGASLTALDAVLDAGLEPANYCEIGGNPSVWKIKELTKLILSQPKVTKLAVIMNVVSNTRVDLVARGVIKGILELGLEPKEVLAAFRIPGSWEDEGQAILRHYGVPFFGRDASIDQVVAAIKWQS